MKRWSGTVTLTASLTLDFDSLDEIVASDEDEAKEQMILIAKETFKEGNYDLDEIRVEDLTQIGNESGE